MTNAERAEAVLDAFALLSDPRVEEIAARSGASVEEVREVLDDPELGKRALSRKRGAASVLVVGKAYDTLIGVLDSPDASPAARLRALEALRSLGFLDRPKPASEDPEQGDYDAAVRQAVAEPR